MENLIYKQIIEESPIAYFSGIVTKDENGKSKGLQIETCNKSFYNLFNIKSEDIIGKDIADILPINQVNRYLTYLDEVFLKSRFSKETYIRELNLNCKVDIYTVDNNHIYARFIEVNNSSLKLAEPLRRAPFIAWIKDIDGRYLDVNEIFLDVENVDYQYIIGKKDYSYMKKERADKYQVQDTEVLKDNKIHTYYVEENIDKTRYYQITKWPYIDEKTNRVLGIIGIAVEKTNEVRLTEELEKSQETFSQIVENIEDIITIRDEEKYYYISPAFEKIHGFKPEDLNLYEDILGLKRHYDNLEYYKTIEEDSLKGISTKLIKIKSNERERWLLSKIFPLTREDNSNLKIGITRDITNLKKMEEKLEEMRMDYFANLSHELRTPINLIFSSLQVLDLKMDKLDLEQFDYFNKYLSIIRQNGYRLLRLVNNLIDTTKIDSGKFSHNPQNKDIINYVEDICMSVSEFVDSNNLSLVFDTNVEEKIISFDQDNIERIILNLLSNAIKFTNQGGRIDVIIECKDNVKIKVKDSGFGIPKDKIDSIFNRFEQLNNKTKDDKEGSGIGLSIVKSLVEMHNGEISVKSKPGEGSEFIITLPDVLNKENTEDTIAMKETSRNISNLNIELSDIYT